MKPQKPITNNIKEKANTLYAYLKKAYPRYCTKEELARVIGCTNERTVRDVIAALSTVRPIIANSTTNGYKVALRPADVEEARHTWAEQSSRVEELQKRMQPLIAFIEKQNRGVCVNG